MVWPGAQTRPKPTIGRHDADLEAAHEPLGKSVIAHALLHAFDRILDAQPLGVHSLEIQDHGARPRVAISRLPDAAGVDDQPTLVDVHLGAVGGRDALDLAVVLAEEQRHMRVADDAVRGIEGVEVAPRDRGREAGTPRGDLAACRAPA